MRLAIVATPGILPDHRPAPGTLDGDLVRARLSLDDAGFRVLDVDPGRDLAEQLDLLFDQVAATARLSIVDVGDYGPPLYVFYASSAVALSAEGELFLCLDPMNPSMGDALADIAAVFRDRARGAVLFVIECHHPPAPEDPFASAPVVAAAKQAVASHLTGIELLVAAQPVGLLAVDTPSPFTRAFVAQLDEADPERGLTAGSLFRRIQEDPELTRAIPCFARVRGQGAIPLLRSRGGAGVTLRSTSPPPMPSSPPGPAAPEAAAIGVAAAEAQARPSGMLADLPSLIKEPDEIRFEPDRILGAPREADPGATGLDAAEPQASEVPMIEVDASFFQLPALEAPLHDAWTEPPAATSAARRADGAEGAPRRASRGASSAPPGAPAPGRPGETDTAPVPPPDGPVAQYLAAGDTLAAAWDIEGALIAYKKALALVGLSQRDARADVYLRIAQARWRQDRRREAIAAFEKALQLAPEHRPALDALVELNVAERDWRGLRTAEERLLSRIESDEDRFAHLVQFAERWESLAQDDARAQEILERARELRPDDLGVLGGLLRRHEVAGEAEEAFAVRRRIAELTRDPREQAQAYFELAKVAMHGETRATMSEITREQLGIDLLDLALDADPTLLEPLAIMAALLAARQEWGELELAYRRMLGRARRIPDSTVQSDVVWELCRRLGLLFRDHLEDPESALAAVEDAVVERPDDLQGRLTAAALARSAGRTERAVVHLQAAAVLDPGNGRVFHDLFDAFQKLRRPDQAWAAASVTMYLGEAEERERFIFEEHRIGGMIKPARALGPEAWELLRASDRDRQLEAVLAVVADAAIRARIAQRASEGKLAQLDPSARQDLQQSTVSVVRSFAWASRCLGVTAPAIYLREDTSLGLAAVMVEEPSVIAGSGAVRGRTLPELAFLVAGHLAYHVGAHRLLLHFPSIEDLSACFVAAVKLVRPALPVPAALEDATLALMPLLDEHLTEQERDELALAVIEFHEAGVPADLGHWAGSVELCSARTGYLLSGDLAIAASPLSRVDALGVLSAEERIGDLLSFTVSDAYHALREELGIAIEP